MSHYDFFSSNHNKYIVNADVRALASALTCIRAVHDGGEITIFRAGDKRHQDGSVEPGMDALVVGVTDGSMVVESLDCKPISDWPVNDIYREYCTGGITLQIPIADAFLGKLDDFIAQCDAEAKDAAEDDADANDEYYDEDSVEPPELSIQFGIAKVHHQGGAEVDALSYAMFDGRTTSYQMGYIVAPGIKISSRILDHAVRKTKQAYPIQFKKLLKASAEGLDHKNGFVCVEIDDDGDLIIAPPSHISTALHSAYLYKAADVRERLRTLYTESRVRVKDEISGKVGFVEQPLLASMIWIDRLPFLSLRGHAREDIGPATLHLIRAVDKDEMERDARINQEARH